MQLPNTQKATKYEHVLPLLAYLEESEDIDGVMQDFAKDMTTALPTDFDIGGSIGSSVSSAAKGVFGGGFSLQLNISTFNNYSSEDIEQLTNEIMVTAGQFARRKGVVFA